MNITNILQTLPQNRAEENILNTLICEDCKNYLNIPPIITFANGDTICGRCYKPGELTAGRSTPTSNRPFEAIVQFIPFPCRYRKEGCTERRTGKNSIIHEQICSYRPFQCPVTDCNWTGITNNLKTHYQEDHSNIFVINGEINIETSTDYDYIYLVVDKEMEFMFQCKFTTLTGTFWCDSICVTTPKCSNSYFMELEFSNSKEKCIVFRKQVFNNTIKEIDTTTALEIDVQSIKTLLHNPETLKAKIKLRLLAETSNLFETELLNELKCPVCDHLFVPPILMCPYGHSVCKFCKEKMPNCPLCRTPLGTIHNYALEQFVTQMNYPCKYNSLGCRFIAPATEIIVHENVCPLAEQA